MARARRRPHARRRRQPSPAPVPPAPAPPAIPASVAIPAPTDQGLLDLARELAAIPGRVPDPVAALSTAVAQLARAWRPDAPLPAAVFEAWQAGRTDSPRALSLAFARAQVALGLQEIIETGVKSGHLRDDIAADRLAWLLMAGCESLAHGGDGSERTHLLLDLCARRLAGQP